jgi:hypothetical protein
MATRTLEVIYCAAGNQRFVQIAREHGFLIGAQLPGTIYDTHLPLWFADQDFKRPRYVAYIQALKKHRPYMASVLDIEEWRRLDEYLMRAEEISQYCTKVMLIPKVNGVIKHLPREINSKEVRLGYSVPTRFGGTTVPIAEFQDWPVHLLGGSPQIQMELAPRFNTASLDGNYAQLMTRYNQFWVPGNAHYAKNKYWPTLVEADGQKWGNGSKQADAPYEAFRRSCKNIMAMWNSVTHV